MDEKVVKKVKDMLCAECLKRSKHGSCAMECEYTRKRFCEEVAQKVRNKL